MELEVIMDEWQPIETAPRNGREILIATRSYLGGVVTVRWEADVPTPTFMDWDGDSYQDATHWMPLPEPPLTTT